MKEAELEILPQKAEVANLNNIIKEADTEQSRQKKEYDGSSTTATSSTAIRRNDELPLLYEKIKIQQSILNKGRRYRDRVNELRILKIKLGDMKRELGVLKSSVGNVDVLPGGASSRARGCCRSAPR